MNDSNNTRPSDRSFSGDVAMFYQSTLVPLIFEPYAEDLAARTRDLAPNTVLEVACGTGVVTRALAAALPEPCEITATDLNSAMIGHAESIGTSRPVTWRQADGTHKVRFEAPIELDRTGDTQRTVEEATIAFTRWLEARIREHPDQWVWIHRRWRRGTAAAAEQPAASA